ncbi:type VI secretion system-associated protein TagO [Vreelandella titanicae]|uniref:type VI secretion system-associated protein TagO n=1 Tax=Vreelandella titanicae TaxID=664683 RepID=UPI003819910B
MGSWKFIGFFLVGIFIVGLLAKEGEKVGETANASSASSDESASEADAEDSSQEEIAESEPEPEKQQARAPLRSWQVSERTSPIDDSKNVWLTVRSRERISNWLGKPSRHATLTLRCMENTTSLMLNMNDNHMADIQSYGDVTFRLDSDQAFTRSMRESTDNQMLGLWSGGRSIPVIKQMFDHDQITVRATPYSQSSITVTFPAHSLREQIEPLREACHW